MTRLVLCCGSGGVGKTTTSAALGIALARRGHRVAAITIDPARRLADALGLEALHNDPQPVPLPPDTPGTLHAMMLDRKATFDQVVARFAADEATLRRILDNRTYRFVSTRLSGTQEFMAMERIHELVTCGRWDHVVVDTPPARQAVDFLTAPARLARLFDQRVARWLALPRNALGFRILERGSHTVVTVLRRMLGTGTITDIAEFFSLFQGMWEGFRTRALEFEEMLRQPDTRFLLVTSPSPAAGREAEAFVAVLEEAGMGFAGMLVNRVPPRPAGAVPPPRGRFPPPPPDLAPGTWDAIVEGVCRSAIHQCAIAEAAQDLVRELERGLRGAPAWAIPERIEEPHDLPALEELAVQLTPVAEAVEAYSTPAIS